MATTMEYEKNEQVLSAFEESQRRKAIRERNSVFGRWNDRDADGYGGGGGNDSFGDFGVDLRALGR